MQVGGSVGWRGAALVLVILAAAFAFSDRSEEGPVEDSPSTASPAKGTEPVDASAAHGFDFWVLSLSWSPSYCEVEGENANRQQCESGRRYAFVVHGLWPQYERGWPEDCATDEPSVDNATLSSLYDIMPSAGLIRHQWRKHGTCSGLSQDDYFRVLRAARERVEIPGAYAKATTWRMIDPNQIERDFLSDNNGLMENALAVTCDDRYLREVRMCLTIGLDYRPCPEVDRRSCTLTRAAMPSARGR